ncbi:hypothetical protein X953_15185 [Virgibacillus sp. SK37]|nr:hypothetical protein X953_15185 [Virgibacillus sp. SK37]
MEKDIIDYVRIKAEKHLLPLLFFLALLKNE